MVHGTREVQRVVAVVAAAFVLPACPADKSAPAFRYDSQVVDEGAIRARVTASGALNPLVNVQVGTQVSGRVSEIRVDFNSNVHKGDLLARIDPRFFEAALEHARANLATARGTLARAEAERDGARRTLARAEKQHAAAAIPEAEVETARTAASATQASVDAARGGLMQAEAALKQAELNLQYTAIRSPIDGVVISRAVDVGQTVAASFQSPVLFVIAGDLRSMQVEANISESDVGRVAAGMPASFTVDAYPGRVFPGVVRQVRNAPVNVQNVVTYVAVVDVVNEDLLLKPGMTATVGFIHAEREKVVRIPNAALRFRPPREMAAAEARSAGPPPEGNLQVKGRDPAAMRRTVYVLRDGVPEPRTVTIGITDGVKTELVEGDVHAGDTLVTGAVNLNKAKPTGMPRRVL